MAAATSRAPSTLHFQIFYENIPLHMRNSDFGRPNLGGMAGAVVGAIGGLFALGLIPAIITGSVRLMFSTPILNLFCWLVSLPTGWFTGGFIGRRLGNRFRSERAEIAGGVLGGLVPVIVIAFFGWYIWRGQL
jgi:hypothetical protein